MEYRIWVPVDENDTMANVRYFVERELVKRFGGFTCVFGVGGWANANGEVVNEAVAVYTAIKVGPPCEKDAIIVRRIARYVRVKCRQEAVLWSKGPCEAEMVTA